MKKLNKYDAQKLALLERFFWEVQATVYRTQAAAAAEDLDFEAAAELRDQLIIVKGQLGQKLVPKKKKK